jgi:Mrp family chromosome partitioning ATPase
MLESSRLAQGFARMKAVADIIIVDSAPVLEASDALMLAGVSDLVVMVADPRRTSRADANSSARQIRAVGLGTIVGVLNRMPRSLRSVGTRPAVSHEQEWGSAAPNAPAVLGSLVPPRGPNGKGGASHSAAWAQRHDPEAGE